MKKFVCTLSDISPDSYEDIVRRISVMFDTFRRIDENTLADGDITIGFQYNNADKTAEIQSDADIPDEIFEGCKADIGRNFTKSEETAEKRPNIFGNAGFFGISAVFAAAVFGIIIIDTALMYGALLLNESLKTALIMHIPQLLISAAMFAVIRKMSGKSRFERASLRLMILIAAVIWMPELSGYSLLPVYAPVMGAAYFCTLGQARERIGGNTFKAEAAQLTLTLGIAAVMWAAGAVIGGLGGVLLVSVARSAVKISASGMVLAAMASLLSRRAEAEG